jgi:ubiquinone/menaquinone biosynthesis C-methylase UbiE
MTKERDAVAHFSGFVEEFDAYYEGRSDFQERLAIWRELLDRYAPHGGLSIDMGCGTGVFTFYLAGKGGRVVGVDGGHDMITFCEARRLDLGLQNVRFIEARLPDVDDAGLGDAGLVISSSVVEYVDDLDGTLALFARVLKRGGALIISMPNVFCLNRTAHRLKYALTGEPRVYQHIRHLSSPRALHRRLEPLGFTLDQVRYYNHYTMFAKLLRLMRLPLALTEDLFVAVFRKS